MRDAVKPLLFAASTIVVALVLAAADGELEPIDVAELATATVAWPRIVFGILLFGAPLGLLWAALVAATGDRHEPPPMWLRVVVFVATAIFVAWLVTFPWPAITYSAISSLVIHAVWLARWTQPETTLAKARVVR